MNKEYEELQLDIIVFETDDVIVTSQDHNEGPFDG
jgi:hypothetical protein